MYLDVAIIDSKFQEDVGRLSLRKCMIRRDCSAITLTMIIYTQVYVPIDAGPSTPLPVLVFWHGGGYQSGNSHSYTPEWLMQSSANPFIFVTFEYRLGQFGFLGR